MHDRGRIDVVVAGIFVGGESRRMGGRPKGLLVAPPSRERGAERIGETLVERWRRMFDALGIPCVLIGKRDAYASLGIDGIDDDPPGIGPLGGLIALLARAHGGASIVVACDMPFVSEELLGKLASQPSTACAIAPKRGNVWEPLFARYDGPLPLRVATRHAATGKHSMYGVLDALDAEPLALTDDEFDELRDWDTPPAIGT